MTLLVGSEAEGPSTSAEIKAGKAVAFRFEAAVTGTVETLKVKLVSILGTHLVLALLADNAEKPGTVLAEGEKALPGIEVEVSITPQEVVKGTFYWLTLLPIAGNCHVKDHGAGGTKDAESSNAAITKVSEATWNAPVSFGPMAIAGLGTEGLGGTATLRGGTRIITTGSKTGIGSGVLRVAAGLNPPPGILEPPEIEEEAPMVSAAVRMTATGTKEASGTAVLRAGAGLRPVGGKVATGTATIHSASKNTASGSKMAAGTIALDLGARSTALGVKLASGVGRLRAAASSTASGVKAAAGTAILRAATELEATSEEPVFKGNAVIRTTARVIGAAGGRSTQGEAQIRAALITTNVGRKGASGQAVLSVASRIREGFHRFRGALGLPGRSNPTSARRSAGLAPKVGLAPKIGLAPSGMGVKGGGAGRSNPRPAHYEEEVVVPD